jgi:hypothetical protein
MLTHSRNQAVHERESHVLTFLKPYRLSWRWKLENLSCLKCLGKTLVLNMFMSLMPVTETDSGINGDQSLGITIVAAQSEVLHEHNAHCIMLNQKHVCTSACTKSTCDMAEYK